MARKITAAVLFALGALLFVAAFAGPGIGALDPSLDWDHRRFVLFIMFIGMVLGAALICVSFWIAGKSGTRNTTRIS